MPVIRQVRLSSELLVAVVTFAFFVCFVWFLFSQSSTCHILITTCLNSIQFLIVRKYGKWSWPYLLTRRQGVVSVIIDCLEYILLIMTNIINHLLIYLLNFSASPEVKRSLPKRGTTKYQIIIGLSLFCSTVLMKAKVAEGIALSQLNK